MIWYWSRDNQRLRFETLYDNDRAEFVIVIEYPDGRQVSERFSAIDKLRSRLKAVDQELESDHWTLSGPPLLVPERFPNRRLAPQPPSNGYGGLEKTVATRTYAAGARHRPIARFRKSRSSDDAY